MHAKGRATAPSLFSFAEGFKLAPLNLLKSTWIEQRKLRHVDRPPLNPDDLELEWMEEEFDSPAEVDAVFRAQRRLSFLYGSIFLTVTMSIPVLSITSDYWTSLPVLGGFTLNYLFVAVLYHLVYVLIGAAYTLQANRLEQELLGRRR